VNQLALFCVVSLGSAAARPPLLAVRRPKEVITGPGLHLAAVATVPKLDPDRVALSSRIPLLTHALS